MAFRFCTLNITTESVDHLSFWGNKIIPLAENDAKYIQYFPAAEDVGPFSQIVIEHASNVLWDLAKKYNAHACIIRSDVVFAEKVENIFLPPQGITADNRLLFVRSVHDHGWEMLQTSMASTLL